MLDTIAELCTRFPDNQDTALEQAKAAFNLTIVYSGSGELAEARAMLSTIAELRTRFSHNQDIALIYDKVANNLSIANGNSG